MDYLYTAERASRKRLWDGLVRLDEEERRNRSNRITESSEEEIRQPLSIVQVKRDGENNYSELLELCYRSVNLVILKLVLTDSSPDEYCQEWLCSLC